MREGRVRRGWGRTAGFAVLALAACAKPRDGEAVTAAPEDASVAPKEASSPVGATPSASSEMPEVGSLTYVGGSAPWPKAPPHETTAKIDGGGVHAAKVSSNRWRFEACYTKHLSLVTPTTAGVIAFEIAVDATGHPDVTVASTTVPAGLTQCCRGSVENIHFDAGAPTTFTVKVTLALKP